MSALAKRNVQNLGELGNPFWKKEAMLNGLIVLNTIGSEKVSQEISKTLKENNFTLQGHKKKDSFEVNSKYPISSTQTQEVQIDNIRVTEGSIISLKDSKGNKQQVAINDSVAFEERPTENKAVVTTQQTAEFRRVEHERIIFKNEVAREKNSFFFRAKDGENLFKVGDSFFKDFKSGVKYFGFSQLNSPGAQEKTILGIATFMHYFENLKILVISDTLKDTFFNSFLSQGTKQKASISIYPEFKYELYTHEAINFLEMSEIIHRSQEHQIKGFEYLYKSLVEDYDVVLFNLPLTGVTKNRFSFYFPVFQSLESMTLTVSVQNDKYIQIEELKNFFNNYKIKIKGCMIDDNSSKEASV